MAIEKEFDKSVNEILEKSGIRPSPVRILMLRELLKADCPLSAQDIEMALQTVDRSSITRTLATFSEEHVIHQISDGSGSMKYELCKDHCEETHNDEHAHFHCRKCGKTICLNEIPVQVPKIRTGFVAENITFVIQGLCSNCNN